MRMLSGRLWPNLGRRPLRTLGAISPSRRVRNTYFRCMPTSWRSLSWSSSAIVGPIALKCLRCWLSGCAAPCPSDTRCLVVVSYTPEGAQQSRHTHTHTHASPTQPKGKDPPQIAAESCRHRPLGSAPPSHPRRSSPWRERLIRFVTPRRAMLRLRVFESMLTLGTSLRV